jgi:hypothetical protein
VLCLKPCDVCVRQRETGNKYRTSNTQFSLHVMIYCVYSSVYLTMLYQLRKLHSTEQFHVAVLDLLLAYVLFHSV